MSVPGGSRKSNPWPFLAITVLVLLLAAFLVLKFAKPDRAPSVVKEPPPAVEPPPVVETTAPPPAPGPVPKAPAVDEQLAALSDQIEKAVGEKRWDDAERDLKKARALAVKNERLDALRHAIDEGRQEERRAAEEKQRKFDEAFATLKEKIDALMKAEKYDAAVEEAGKFRKTHPYAFKSREFANLFGRVQETRKEARDIADKAIAKYLEHKEAGRIAEAFKALQKARLFFPEGEKEIARLEQELKDLTLYKSMLRIPDQPCWIGNDAIPEEARLRQVTLPAFYVDKYQVTNADYMSFCEATGHRRPPYWKPVGLGGPRKPNPAFLNHPVVFVSLADAEAYAKWAGKRLPTAEEWEVAARGPDKRIYPWGNTFAEQENQFPCNCLEFWQVEKQFSRGTTAVDDPRFSNNVSPWGVYGMAGNVWEYTASRERRDTAGKEKEFVILKGGSFMTPAKAQRCSNVFPEDPALFHPDAGFRCVRDPK